MTEEQKISIGKMIVSDDVEIREMGIALVIANPEYIISLMKARQPNVNFEVDLYKNSFKSNRDYSTHVKRLKSYYFEYNNTYYCLTEIYAFRSMFTVDIVSKLEYESNNPRTES